MDSAGRSSPCGNRGSPFLHQRGGSVKLGDSGSVHTYSESELSALVEHVNRLLSDEQLTCLPIQPPKAVFSAQKDGTLFCHLLRKVQPEAVSLAQVKEHPGSKLLALANHNQALKGSRHIGCRLENISAEDLYDEKEYLVLGLLWQIVKASLLKAVSVRHHPAIVVLATPGEELEAFVKLPPEELLLRWFNYHLRKAGLVQDIKNFSADIRDGFAYIQLLHQLLQERCPLSLLENENTKVRAEHVVRIASAHLNCRGLILPEDISSGNRHVNLAFVAYIFNLKPHLTQPVDNTELKRLSVAKELLDGEVQSLERRLQVERVNQSMVEQLREELAHSRATAAEHSAEASSLRKECSSLREALLTSQSQTLKMSGEQLPELQLQAMAADKRVKEKENQLREAEAAIRQLQEDSAVVQKRFDVILEERNTLRRTMEEERMRLLKQVAELQQQLDAATTSIESLTKAREKTEDMVQHWKEVYERQAVHVSHLKVLFANHQNVRSLAHAIYKDLSAEAILRQKGPAAKSAVLNYVHTDRRGAEELRMYFFVLRDCFLFMYKVNKRNDPADILRVDDTLIDTTTRPNEYYLMVTWLKEDSSNASTFTLKFDEQQGLQEWHDAFASASEYWTGAKHRRQRTRLGHRSV